MKSFFGPVSRDTLNVNNCSESLPDVGTFVFYGVGDVCPCFSKTC